MKVYRQEVEDNIFEKDILAHHNAIMVEDDDNVLYPYDFEIINNETAIIRGKNFEYVKKAIDEFRFYAYFVTKFLDDKQNIVAEFYPVPLFSTPLSSIQPSQFYINKAKMKRLKTWIKSENDIVVPVFELDGKLISLDGHTRLKVAIEMGFQDIYTYFDENDGAYIMDFVKEAQKRRILSINDMPILSNEEYAQKWTQYCEEYFKNKDVN